MLVFHSHCQMANQMFIYACVVSLAKKKRLQYCVSELGHLTYFKLSLSDYLFNGLKYNWFRVANKLTGKYQYHHLQNGFEEYAEAMLQHSANSWYYGYFQGERYFYNNADEIKKRFTIKKKHVKQFNEYYSSIESNKKTVAVHIRRKDYNDFNLKEINGPNLCLPNNYYRKCLEQYVNNEQYQIVFLSDDIAGVHRDFADIPDAVFSKNEAIVDFQILANADVLILANSSFSWWGAWLNQKQEKKVYVPKYFLGFKVKKEFPVNLIPPGWDQVEVYE